MKLRPYQQRAVRTSIGHLRSGRSSVLVSPTGSGKTVMGVAIVADFANPTEGRRVLWLAHREELIQQARDRLIADLGDPIGIISGRRTESADAAIVVASIDSLRRREVERFDLVVVDEAHRTPAASYRKVLASLEGVPVLGLTATPWRLDRRGLKDLYGEMVVAAQPSMLFEQGHQIRPRVYGPSAEPAEAIVAGLKTQAGDFATRAASDRMIEISGDVVATHREYATGLRTIVFAVDRRHGRELTARFSAAGVVTEYLDGDTPAADREGIVRRLRAGETTVVVNVDVLTEGVDIPEVQCVSIARPTKSLTRYLQYCGRAMRPFEGQAAIILDHAGNAYRLNVPYVDRKWTLQDQPKGEGGVAPLARKCHECGQLIEAHLVVCSACSAEIGPREKTVAEREHERLVEMRTRKCKECEVDFVVGYPSDKQVRCLECIEKEKHERNALRWQKCRLCPNVFEQKPSRHNQGRPCDDCRQKRAPKGHMNTAAAEYYRERRQRKKSNGICMQCKKQAVAGGILCEEHRLKQRDRTRLWAAAKRQASKAAE